MARAEALCSSNSSESGAASEGAVKRAAGDGEPNVSTRPFSTVERTSGEPPHGIVYGLDEALDLLAALEDGRDILITTDHLSVLSQVEHQIQILSRKLALDEGGPDVH